jgi:hypothetical protein
MNYPKESTMKQLITSFLYWNRVGMTREAEQVLSAIRDILNKMDE